MVVSELACYFGQCLSNIWPIWGTVPWFIESAQIPDCCWLAGIPISDSIVFRVKSTPWMEGGWTLQFKPFSARPGLIGLTCLPNTVLCPAKEVPSHVEAHRGGKLAGPVSAAICCIPICPVLASLPCVQSYALLFRWRKETRLLSSGNGGVMC